MTTHGTKSWLQDQKGYGMGKYPSMSSFWQIAIIYLDAEYSHSFEEGPGYQLKGGSIPLLYQARANTNSTKPDNKPDDNLYPNVCQMKAGTRHEVMP